MHTYICIYMHMYIHACMYVLPPLGNLPFHVFGNYTKNRSLSYYIYVLYVCTYIYVHMYYTNEFVHTYALVGLLEHLCLCVSPFSLHIIYVHLYFTYNVLCFILTPLHPALPAMEVHHTRVAYPKAQLQTFSFLPGT